MAGLLDGVLPAIYSGADQIKRRVKGLLGDPREFLGQRSQDLQTMQDQDSALSYRRGLLSPQDPAYSRMARNEPAFNAQQASAAEQRLLDIALLGTLGGKSPDPEDLWYHGSPVDIYKTKEGWFKPSKGEAGVPVVWGVRDPFTAEGYARGEMALQYDDLAGKFPLAKSYYPDKSGGGVYGLRSAAKNPLEYDAKGEQWFKVPQGKILRDALEKGHDAVIFKNIKDGYQSGGPASDVIAWLNTSAFSRP